MHRRSGNGEGNIDKGRDEDKHMIGDFFFEILKKKKKKKHDW